MFKQSPFLYSTSAIKKLEDIAVEQCGISVDALMQRAGAAALRVLRQEWPHARRVVVVCGKGNNAGDGYVVARCAHEAGLGVEVLHLAPLSALRGAALNAAQACVVSGVKLRAWSSSLPGDCVAVLRAADVIVDALLGTGLQGALQREYRDVIALVNSVGAAGGGASNGADGASVPAVLALDVPSGLVADRGALAGGGGDKGGVVVRARVTVTFIGIKCGLVTGAGVECCGKVICDDLDLPAEIFGGVNVSAGAVPIAHILDLASVRAAMAMGLITVAATAAAATTIKAKTAKARPKTVAALKTTVMPEALAMAAATLPWRRSRNAHKGDFGHVLVLGGDHGMGGAVRMAAEAAARVGAGLVSVGTRAVHVSAINTARPEIMCHVIERASDVEALLARATCVVIGPGLGQAEWGRMIFNVVRRRAFASLVSLPCVIDADALYLLAESASEGEVGEVGAGGVANNFVLTPHPGEAARLFAAASKAEIADITAIIGATAISVAASAAIAAKINNAITAATVQADRYAAIEALQNYYGGTIVLKGAGTLIKSGETAIKSGETAPIIAAPASVSPRVAPPPAIAVCPYGNPGMASGGMGDVLSGIIGGLLAQSLSAQQAAELGVCLHARAGDMAVEVGGGERGLLALDLLPYMRKLLNAVEC